MSINIVQFLFYPADREKVSGSSLFCMGNSISLLSAEEDYMRGMLNVERP